MYHELNIFCTYPQRQQELGHIDRSALVRIESIHIKYKSQLIYFQLSHIFSTTLTLRTFPAPRRSRSPCRCRPVRCGIRPTTAVCYRHRPYDGTSCTNQIGETTHGLTSAASTHRPIPKMPDAPRAKQSSRSFSTGWRIVPSSSMRRLLFINSDSPRDIELVGRWDICGGQHTLYMIKTQLTKLHSAMRCDCATFRVTRRLGFMSRNIFADVSTAAWVRYENSSPANGVD